jgi:hypothetical protein
MSADVRAFGEDLPAERVRELMANRSGCAQIALKRVCA